MTFLSSYFRSYVLECFNAYLLVLYTTQIWALSSHILSSKDWSDLLTTNSPRFNPGFTLRFHMIPDSRVSLYPVIHSSIHSPIHPHLSIHPPNIIHLSIHPFIHLRRHPTIYPFIHLIIYLPAHPSFHPTNQPTSIQHFTAWHCDIELSKAQSSRSNGNIKHTFTKRQMKFDDRDKFKRD